MFTSIPIRNLLVIFPNYRKKCVRTNVSCLSLNFENQRLEKYSSFLWYCNFRSRGFYHELPGCRFLEVCEYIYLTSECWPGFNLLPHSSHRKQPGCHTLPREFLCSAVKKTHKQITNLIARCCCFTRIFFEKRFTARRWFRMEQSCLSFLEFYKRIILQSTGGISFFKASTYQNILVYHTYDIQSSRLSQVRRPNKLTSRRATKNSTLARKVRSCQWRHAPNIPKCHCLRKG